MYKVANLNSTGKFDLPKKLPSRVDATETPIERRKKPKRLLQRQEETTHLVTPSVGFNALVLLKKVYSIHKIASKLLLTYFQD